MKKLLTALLILAMAATPAFAAGKDVKIHGWNKTQGDWSALRVDDTTRALMIMDYDHHELHEGSHFTWSDVQLDIDTGENWDLVVTTPNTTKWAHVLFNFDVENQTQFTIFEGATSTGGTAVTEINSNRNSATVSTTTLINEPTVTGYGTEIFQMVAGGGSTPAAASPGNGRRGSEFILKQNTVYLFQLQGLADNNDCSMTVEWYEHTNATSD